MSFIFKGHFYIYQYIPLHIKVRLIATISPIKDKKGLIEKKHYESAHVPKSKKIKKNAKI